jgi:palmitoyltransferase
MSVNMEKAAEKPNEKIDSSVIHIPASLELDLYKHFCPACNVDQPIRTKHCKDCGVCVATFDHHCIWAGNCVGEYNRPFYFIFLNTQLLSLALLVISPLVSSNRPVSLLETISFYAVLALIGGIFVGLAGLLYYHYKFLFSNVTTCTALVTQGSTLSGTIFPTSQATTSIWFHPFR